MKYTIYPALAMALALTACAPDETGSTMEQGADDAAAGAAEAAAAAATANPERLCLDMGPQTPRDISDRTGLNTVSFPMAPPASEMNLCNIHTHTNAEHKGPGFSVFVGDADAGGYA